jgi:hypothetical protein
LRPNRALRCWSSRLRQGAADLTEFTFDAPDLDESVDGLLLMGHHAKAGTDGAFLPHTWSLEQPVKVTQGSLTHRPAPLQIWPATLLP